MILIMIFLAVTLALLFRRGRAYTVMLAASLLLFTMLMGGPKPHWAIVIGERLIVAAEYDPEENIYIWVRADPPIAVRLPWSEDLAKKLQAGMRDAKALGLDGVKLRYKGDRDYSIEPGEPTRLPPAASKGD